MLVKIGGVQVDLLTSFDIESSAEVTSHPVEEGVDISDHAHLPPVPVQVTVLIKGQDAESRLSDLEDKQRKKKLVDFIGPRKYKNMFITKIKPDYSHDVANGHLVSITLEHVKVTRAKEVVIKVAKPTPKTKPKTNGGTKQPSSGGGSMSDAELNKMAKEVIRGNWGNNPSRKRRLEKEGYNYSQIQAKVNAMLR